MKPRAAPRRQLASYVVVVVVTAICTRLLPQAPSECSQQQPPARRDSRYADFGSFFGVFGQAQWPEQGYGTRLALRIYVYEEAEIEGLRELLGGRDHSIVPSDCIKGQWGTQVKIHRFLFESSFRTRNKREAQLFFVPCYVKCVRMKGGLSDKEINAKYVQILEQMPYFHRSGGRDHVFVFPSGAGAHLFKQWSVYLNRSIFLTPEGDRTDKRDTSAFNTWKDIIIPGNVDNEIPLATWSVLQDIKPLPLSKRKFLANFLGRAQQKAGRLQLLELAKRFPEELEVPRLELSGPSKLDRRGYFKHLGNAKFCLAPRGESSWTLRFFESFFVVSQRNNHVCFEPADSGRVLQECVPVILSDHIELPFQNVLDYTSFSIKWPARLIKEQLVDYLRSIPEADIERMLARGRQVRCLWVYAPPQEQECSAMTGILWELQRKVRLFHHSSESFWLHNRSIVDSELKSML